MSPEFRLFFGVVSLLSVRMPVILHWLGEVKHSGAHLPWALGWKKLYTADSSKGPDAEEGTYIGTRG
jgi:hypothetical protein